MTALLLEVSREEETPTTIARVNGRARRRDDKCVKRTCEGATEDGDKHLRIGQWRGENESEMENGKQEFAATNV